MLNQQYSEERAKLEEAISTTQKARTELDEAQLPVGQSSGAGGSSGTSEKRKQELHKQVNDREQRLYEEKDRAKRREECAEDQRREHLARREQALVLEREEAARRAAVALEAAERRRSELQELLAREAELRSSAAARPPARRVPPISGTQLAASSVQVPGEASFRTARSSVRSSARSSCEGPDGGDRRPGVTELLDIASPRPGASPSPLANLASPAAAAQSSLASPAARVAPGTPGASSDPATPCVSARASSDPLISAPSAKAKAAPPLPPGGTVGPKTVRNSITPKESSEPKLISLHLSRASIQPKPADVNWRHDSFIAESNFDWESIEATQSRFESCVSNWEQTTGCDEQIETPAAPGRERKRNTVFRNDDGSGSGAQNLPKEQLKEFFQAQKASVDINSRSSVGNRVQNFITNKKHVDFLDGVLGTHLTFFMQDECRRLGREKKKEAAVDEIVQAVRSCNYEKMPRERLKELRKVVEDKTMVDSLLQVPEDQLVTLEHPHLHRMMRGFLQIPDVAVRLDCMIFESAFLDEVSACQNNLKIVRDGLAYLTEHLSALRLFFALARRYGNDLNRSSKPQLVTTHGFSLRSLPQLWNLKSPKCKEAGKEVSLLHFIVLLMPPHEVDALCDTKNLERLKKAKEAGMTSSYTDCTQFLESFEHIAKLAATGEHRGRAIGGFTQAPDSSAAAAGEGDEFHGRMRELARGGRAKAELIKRFTTDNVEAYVNIARYFEALEATMKGAKGSDSDKGETPRDLCDIFHELVAEIKKVRADPQTVNLARTIKAHFQDFSFPLVGEELLGRRGASPRPRVLTASSAARAQSAEPTVSVPQDLEPRDLAVITFVAGGRAGVDGRPLPTPMSPSSTMQPPRHAPGANVPAAAAESAGATAAEDPVVPTPGAGPPPRRVLQKLPAKPSREPLTITTDLPVSGSAQSPAGTPLGEESKGVARPPRKSMTRTADRIQAACVARLTGTPSAATAKEVAEALAQAAADAGGLRSLSEDPTSPSGRGDLSSEISAARGDLLRRQSRGTAQAPLPDTPPPSPPRRRHMRDHAEDDAMALSPVYEKGETPHKGPCESDGDSP